jgi:hypothetical protein
MESEGDITETPNLSMSTGQIILDSTTNQQLDLISTKLFEIAINFKFVGVFSGNDLLELKCSSKFLPLIPGKVLIKSNC